MTVKAEVLKSIIEHYPSVPSHRIHRASVKHPFSTGQRLRELKGEGVVRYTYHHATKCYRIFTKLPELKKALKEMN